MNSFVRACMEGREAVREVVNNIKDRVLGEYALSAGEHLNVLRLALNEAEALAWDTEFPHLFFPALAMEKAEATVAWHQRQRSVRRAAAEFAFAE